MSTMLTISWLVHPKFSISLSDNHNIHITTTTHCTMKVKLSKASTKSAVTKATEGRLSQACDQMQQLLDHISYTKTRHQRALKHNQPNRCRQLQVQLQVLQGMYNVFYQYADLKARQVAALHLATDSATHPTAQPMAC